MSKAKVTAVRIGQIEVGTETGAGGLLWTLTEVAITCQKTGFQQIVKNADEALDVAKKYATAQKNGYVYRALLPTAYAQALTHLPRS
jgi:hypothetical protein